MTKEQFLFQLEQKLLDIPEDERAEAMEYYRDYFNDAGPENEEQVIELSESTLYPVLRRLQKDACLEVYDMECAGRNRRYYKITPAGWAQLQLYEAEWRAYSDKITGLFEGKDIR